jgi:putative DNA primase/helicase
MSPKATEGVLAREVLTPCVCDNELSPVEPTPSGLPAISPSRREIGSFGPASSAMGF